MKSKYKDGNSISLEARVDDLNLINLSKEFLKDLEENFIEFNEKYKKNEELNKNYLNKSKFIFTPEVLTKKSPLTIINAPWGSGKTFFIESFTKGFIDELIVSNIFESIIIIDAWKFSSSISVPLEFAAEISKNIVSLYNFEESIKESMIKRIFQKITPNELILGTELNLGILKFTGEAKKNVKSENNDENIDRDREFKKFENNEMKTIIFVDNLERLGSHSWDLLKSIIKLQEFPNFLIVLPLNINKMYSNNNENSNEYPIQKYIDFNYYNFKQDYLNFLNSKFEDANIVARLNSILEKEINGAKLSIREVKTLFEKHKIFSINDEYKLYKAIKNFIWDPSNLLNEIILEDIEKYKEYHVKKAEVVRKFYKDEIELKWKNHILNSEKKHIENFKSGIFDVIDGERHYYDINKNYINEIIKMKWALEKTKKIIDEKIQLLNGKIEQKRDEIISAEDIVNDAIKKMNKYESDLNLYNEKQSQLNSEWEAEIASKKNVKYNYQKTRVENLKIRLNSLKGELSIFNKENEYLKFDLEQSNSNIYEKNIEYLESIEEDKLPILKYNHISKFLIKNYENRHLWEKNEFSFANLSYKLISFLD